MYATRAKNCSRHNAAYSLVEVVAAVALMAATLVPAISFVRDAMEVSVEADERQLICLYAVSQVEALLAATAHTWAGGTQSGDYSADGRADIRFEAVADDATLSGGIPGSLMNIEATVYVDADADDTLDADELSCFFRTKLARFNTYEELDD